MKKASISTLAILSFLLISVVACTTSQVPYPTAYDLSKQKKMQAADHWRVMAKDIASVIEARLDKAEVVSISRKNDEPIYAFFANFLEQELINDGYSVNMSETPGVTVVVMEARVLEHNGRDFRSTFGMFDVLKIPLIIVRDFAIGVQESSIADSSIGSLGGTGVLDTKTGSLPVREVLITVKGVKNNQLMLSANNLYYINEAESWQYDSSPYTFGNAKASRSMQTKKMAVTGI